MENQCGLCGNYDGEKQNDFRTAEDESTEDIQQFHRSFINNDEECKLDDATVNDKSKYELLEESEEDRKYTEDKQNKKVETKWSDDSEEDNLNGSKKSQNKRNNNSEKKWSKKSKSSNSEEDNQNEEINAKITEKIALKKSEKKITSQISEEIDSETEVETIENTKVVEFSHRICFSTEPIPHCPKNAVEGKTIQKKVRFSCLARHEPEARRLLEQSRKTSQPLSLPTLPVAYVDSIYVPQACKAN